MDKQPKRQPSQPSERPVAYDADNKPLYANPTTRNTQDDEPTEAAYTASHVTNAPESHEGHNFDPRMRAQYGNEPRVVHNKRDYEPKVNEVSEDLQRRHDESCKKYPKLNLSEGECVLVSVTRHPIGLIVPMAVTIFLIIILLSALISFPLLFENPATGVAPGLVPFTVAVLCLIILIGIGGYVAVWVYLQNTFYLTNESVIQEIQHSLFAKREQTVSLGSIEDASFRQNGILQTTLNYGTIRLSTEGEETTYRFHYVSNPKKQIARLNNAVESFKNGRPVNLDDN